MVKGLLYSTKSLVYDSDGSRLPKEYTLLPTIDGRSAEHPMVPSDPYCDVAPDCFTPLAEPLLIPPAHTASTCSMGMGETATGQLPSTMGFLQGIGQFFDGPKQIVIPVKSTAISPTYTIVLIIFGLVFFFQPLVFDAYKKGKARYAWRKIDNGNKVEVLDYKRTRMWDVRGQWDARRVTALLLFVFDIAMIILVLQMDVAYESDAAVENFYIQPPPVCVNNTTWEVTRVVVLFPNC